MIASWRDRWLEKFFTLDVHSSRIPSEIRKRLFRKLQMIDDATADADLRSPPSNHFEALSGNLKGWHSIRVNDQWRLIFKWNGSEASDLYLDNQGNPQC
jgi:proteic killer suppression protein